MHEQPRALDVAQEARPQPVTLVGALDEPGDVGQHEALFFAHRDHAQARLERGEGVVGDLGVRGREARDERGLAGVGEAHQADVGEQLQLQPQPALFAGLARVGAARGAVGGAGEAGVAAAAAPSASRHPALAGRGEVEQPLAALFLEKDRPDRHADEGVFAFAPVAVRAFPVAAALAAEFAVVAEGQERVQVLGGLQHDVAAVAAVAARRAAPRDVLLPAEGNAAVAAVAGLHPDFGLVNEHVSA